MIDTIAFVLLVTAVASLPLGHWQYLPPLRTWRRP